VKENGVMLSRALRLSLVLEAALYFAAALFVGAFEPATAGLLALAGVALLRAAATALTFVAARACSGLPPWQTLRLVVGEYAAILANFVVISPFENWWMDADRLQADGASVDTRPPILLVHGYCCSRASWWWLRRRLRGAGWRVATINLEPVFTSIDNYVEPLARRVDEVLAETGSDQLIVIGHSMRGLVARAYLRRFGEAKVARLVTLGTPHQGSRLAVIGFGDNARQMLPDSAWLQSLSGSPTRPDTLVIYSGHDNFVTPQDNLLLPGAHGVAIDGVGHLAMLLSPRVARILLLAIEEDTAVGVTAAGPGG